MIGIIDCGSQKTPYIEQMVDISCDFKTYRLLDFKLEDLDNVAGVIISGAPILLTEVDQHPYLEKFTWLSSFEKPVLGICFGHQIIGLHFGAFVSRQKEDRDWQEIEILEESILFDKLPNEFQQMEDHCESISVPPNFNLIATSDSCVNEAMQHKTKRIFGVQFHPEVSGNLGQVLITNFVSLCLNKNH